MKKGDKFQVSFKVDESVYNGFIETFKDRNPLHVDDEFARSKGFDGKIMQGNILNGFLSYFVGEKLPDRNVIILSQQINFNLPVYLNDSVELHAEISDVHNAVGMIEIRYHFENEKSLKVAKGKIQIAIK